MLATLKIPVPLDSILDAGAYQRSTAAARAQGCRLPVFPGLLATLPAEAFNTADAPWASAVGDDR